MNEARKLRTLELQPVTSVIFKLNDSINSN